MFTHRLMSTLDQWFGILSDSVGLSISELKILAFLDSKPSNDTAQWAATQLGISKALVSKVVEQLCTKGYLAQVQDRDDRRCYHLIVQESAMPLLDSVNSELINSWKILTEGISGEEFDQYLDIMRRMLGNISRGYGLSVPEFLQESEEEHQ